MNNTSTNTLYLYFIWLLCSIGLNLNAQKVDLKLEPIACNGELTLEIKIKAATSSSFELGNSSILLNYDSDVFTLDKYITNEFDPNTSTQAAQAKWQAQQWTVDNEFGIFNLVLTKEDGGTNQYTLNQNEYITIGSLVLIENSTGDGTTVIQANEPYTKFYDFNQAEIGVNTIPVLSVDRATLENKGEVGAVCDDGNPETENDKIQADGCTCQGQIQSQLDLELANNSTKKDVKAGDKTTWVVRISNKSDIVATNVTVKDSLPSGIRILRVRRTKGEFDQATGIWTIGTLDAQETVTLSIRTSITQSTAGTMRSFAQIMSASPEDKDSTPGNDIDQTADEDDEAEISITVQWLCGDEESDADNDGICSDSDCDDNDPSIGAKQAPNTACDDGNPETENDKIQADGCTCEGTIPAPTCSDGSPLKEVGSTCDDGNPETENDKIQADGCTCEGTIPAPTCSDGSPLKEVGSTCDDGNPETENDKIQADGCTCEGTIPAPTCSDGSPLKEVGSACDDGNPETENDKIQADGCTCEGTIPAPTCSDGSPLKEVGSVCNDENPNTINDRIQADGCTCEGTVNGGCNSIELVNIPNGFTVNNIPTTAKIDYLGISTGWSLAAICNGSCNSTATLENLIAGEYIIKVQNFSPYCYEEYRITVNSGSNNNCDTKGGDTDGDGICDNEDNCPSRANPDQADNDNDGIGNLCDDTPNGGNAGNCESLTVIGDARQFTISNIPSSVKLEYLGPSTSWTYALLCEGDCNSTYTVSDLNEGEYIIKTQSFNPYCYKEYRITISNEGGNNACIEQGGDTDGDGICDDLDNCPDTANPNQADSDNDNIGDVCDPTPNGGNGGSINCGEDVEITFGNGNIEMVGANDKSYFYKINDLNNGWSQIFGCGWNCGNRQTATNIPNGTYFVTIYNSDWSKHCEATIEMTNSSFNVVAQSRTTAQFDLVAYPKQQEVALNWYTNSGDKVSHFEIEKATANGNFETLAQLTNKKWDAITTAHQIIDSHPVYGKNAYRVKEVYLDGSFQYTPIQELDFSLNLDKIAVYPNPATDAFFINMKPFKGKEGLLNIVNQFGQLIKSFDLNNIEQDVLKVDTEEMTNGLYILQLSISQQKVHSEKLLIQKLY